MKFEITPIGYLRTDERYRYETPRQGVFANNSGVIELNKGCGYEAALSDLDRFDRIWVIFIFHLNETWNPKVQPPFAPDGAKIGLFATRSPHRPNRLGMTCVKLDKIEKNKIYIRNFDMLDNTPIIDIKPYVPRADSFPDASIGWLEDVFFDSWDLKFDPIFLEDNKTIVKLGGPDLENFCRVQLSSDPINQARKRIYKQDELDYEIGCRTWRIGFSLNHELRSVSIKYVRSNYSETDLAIDAEDKYGDLDIHRKFLAKK